MGGRKSDLGWKGTFATNLSKRVGFPDMTRKTEAEALSASFVSGVFDDHRWATGAGAFVESSGKFYHVQVENNSGSIMQVSPALPVAAGDDLFVYPELEGRVVDSLAARHVTSSVFESDLTFEAYADQSRIKDLLAWEPQQWYRDRPLALWAPNWIDRVQENWAMPEFSFDTGYGLPWFQPKLKSPIRTASYKALIRGKEDADELVSFFCYCRGRQASFYAPTWTDDFIFTTPTTEGQNTLRVRGQGPLKLFSESNVFRNIAVRVGSTFHLTGVVDVYAFGSDCEVVLATPIPEGFSGATRASWLLRQRFSADNLELEYRSDRVAETDIKTVSVIEDFEVIKISGYELTIGGYYVTLGAERDTSNQSDFTAIGGFNVSIGGDFLA